MNEPPSIFGLKPQIDRICSQIKNQKLFANLQKLQQSLAQNEKIIYFFKSLQTGIDFAREKIVSRYQVSQAPSMAKSAIILALGVSLINIFLIGNEQIFAAQENPWDNFVDVNPETSSAAVREISKFTPILDQFDPEAVVLALQTEASDVLATDFKIDRTTEPTELEQEYIIEKGDTVGLIAAKFDLHVASILERNKLSVDDLNSLKPGQKIIIPSRDISDSKEWLIAVNEKKEKESKERAKQEEERRRKLAISGSTRSGNRLATTRERSSGGFDGESQGAGGFIIPINHNGITRGVSRIHDGIDYRADTGTPVRVAADGRIIEITGGWGSGFGISVLVDHGGGLTTRYAHLSGSNVGVGDSVSQGETIARSGNTGFSTGPHLHFETRRGGRVLSPF